MVAAFRQQQARAGLGDVLTLGAESISLPAAFILVIMVNATLKPDDAAGTFIRAAASIQFVLRGNDLTEKQMNHHNPSNVQTKADVLVTAGDRSKAHSPDPASALVKVDLAGWSHRGHVRPVNEDHYFAARIERALKTLTTNLAEGTLPNSFEETAYGLLVADGLGGMAAGEVASSSALCKLVELVVNTPDWIMRLGRSEDMDVVLERMTERFRLVDDDLREQGRKDPALGGMGTTLTVATSLGAELVIGHIGDSRAYLLRGKRLHQLTRDHTMAQALIDAGIAHPQDATTRAMRHVLTAALGSTGEKSDPEVQRLRLRDDDQLLLCTDGLTEMVEDKLIASTLSGAASADEACGELIDLALAAGGTDNVTAVVARYTFPSVAA